MAAALKIAPAAPATAPAKPRRKKPAPVPTPPSPAPAPALRADRLHGYAATGVGVMAAMSALLNGYANGSHAPVAWAGWLMGLAVPAVILLLGKVAGKLWKRGARPLALATAGSGVGLLGLSVWHCSNSIALLTGSPLALAVPMAVAVDVGFVACELALLEDK